MMPLSSTLRLITAALLALTLASTPVLAQPAATPASRLDELDQLRRDVQRMGAAAAYLKGRHAQAEGDLEVAYIYLNRAYQQQGGSEGLAGKLFFLAMATGHIAKAAEVSALIPDDSRVGYLGQLARIAAAVKADRLDAALEIDLSSGLPLFDGQANDLIRAWLDPAGETASSVIAALSPDAEESRAGSPRNMLHAAYLLAARGELDAAAALLGEALETGQALRHARALAAVEVARGNVEAARAAYDALDPQMADAADIAVDLARLEAGDAPVALPRTPADGLAIVFYDIANGFNQARSPDLALVFSQTALYLRPDLAIARLMLGNMLILRENFTDADDVLLSVSETDPLWWAAHLRASDALALAEDDQRARDLLERLLEKRPDRIDALARLGDLERGNRDFEAAIETYSQAIALLETPLPQSSWNLFYSRGIAYERNGQWPEAEADFQQALALAPEQPYVLNYLGYSWADQGKNLDEALDMIRRAVAQRPQDGYLVDSLGWVYYRLGRYEEALEELEKAVALEPSEADIVDHYGDALWKLGRQREARYQWRRALGLAEESEHPNAELIQAISGKLEAGL